MTPQQEAMEDGWANDDVDVDVDADGWGDDDGALDNLDDSAEDTAKWPPVPLTPSSPVMTSPKPPTPSRGTSVIMQHNHTVKSSSI